MTHFTSRSLAVLTLVAALAVGVPTLSGMASAHNPTPAASTKPAPASDFALSVASNAHPRLVSGGQVLLRVDFPLGMNEKSIKVMIGKRNVTKAFKLHSPRYLLGLVSGLKNGKSVITATGPGHKSSVAVVNHSINGPVFSGAQQKPFYCETTAYGLKKAKQPECSAPTKVTYEYKNTSGKFTALADPSKVPADAATATVDGQTLPYIVRVERGTIDRAVYEIAAIYDGKKPSPQDNSYEGWNGKLIYTFGGGCNSGFHQGNSTGGVLNDLFLSRGYAVASSSLNVLDNNCSPIISAEAAMMVKEHFIETYGPVAFTMGWGGSGGGIQQYDIADAYPGILDGIIPGISFPDPIATAGPVTDCKVLRNYFNGSASTLTADQVKAVQGFLDPVSCGSWVLAFSNRASATASCNAAIPVSAQWDPVKNPKGVICNMQSQFANQFGRDPKTGFVRSVLDNTGIQYGLDALLAGTITPAQFADMNAKVGGLDYKGDIVAQRSSGDLKAIKAAYADDVINSASLGLKSTPIIDDRYDFDFAGTGYDIHTTEWSLVMRARLDAANGTHDNQVILASQPSQTGLADAYALTQMDAWLTAIKGDTDAGTAQEKVLRDKPSTLADSCLDPSGAVVAGSLDDPTSACASMYPVGSNTRLVAGMAKSMYVIKCQLSPIDYSSYKLADGTPIAFTDDEKAELASAFPGGVCDYSKESQGYTKPKGAWLTY